MQKDVCYQLGAPRRVDRRLAWVAVLLIAGLTGCGGNSPSGNDADDEAAAESTQPPAAGSYLRMGEHGQEVMSMFLDVEENRYSLHLADPETNATGSLRGCIVMADAPLVPEADGTYIAKGTELSDEGCSLSFRSIQPQAIEVLAAGCESSCVSPLAAGALSGTYVLQPSLDEPNDEQPPSTTPALSEPPVSVDIVPGAGSVTIIRVVSKMDQVVVLDVIANRDNCPAWIGGIQALSGNLQPAKGMNQQLAFGETADYYINNAQCRLIEVEVNTDAGAWTFTIQ